MEVNVDNTQQLTSDSTTPVTPVEEQMLMGDSTSVASEMARLQVSSPDSQKPEDGETSQ